MLKAKYVIYPISYYIHMRARPTTGLTYIQNVLVS